MGQYYTPFLRRTSNQKYGTFIPITFSSKLMEHSFINTAFMNSIEQLLIKNADYYKAIIVWAGDYADYKGGLEDSFIIDDTDDKKNLYSCQDLKYQLPYHDYLSTMSKSYNQSEYPYIVSHTQKCFIKKPLITSPTGDYIHPLPLLVSEGNGRGNGDYHGINEDKCGTWARDSISIEKNMENFPEYTELICNFKEARP